jgi:hypothetical protein
MTDEQLPPWTMEEKTTVIEVALGLMDFIGENIEPNEMHEAQMTVQVGMLVNFCDLILCYAEVEGFDLDALMDMSDLEVQGKGLN